MVSRRIFSVIGEAGIIDVLIHRISIVGGSWFVARGPRLMVQGSVFMAKRRAQALLGIGNLDQDLGREALPWP